MRIQFTSAQIYETEGPRRGPRFEEGEVYDCREDFAHRWVERNVAVHIEGDFPEPIAPKIWVKVEIPASDDSSSAKPGRGKATADAGAGAAGAAAPGAGAGKAD